VILIPISKSNLQSNAKFSHRAATSTVYGGQLRGLVVRAFACEAW